MVDRRDKDTYVNWVYEKLIVLDQERDRYIDLVYAKLKELEAKVEDLEGKLIHAKVL